MLKKTGVPIPRLSRPCCSPSNYFTLLCILNKPCRSVDPFYSKVVTQSEYIKKKNAAHHKTSQNITKQNKIKTKQETSPAYCTHPTTVTATVPTLLTTYLLHGHLQAVHETQRAHDQDAHCGAAAQPLLQGQRGEIIVDRYTAAAVSVSVSVSVTVTVTVAVGERQQAEARADDQRRSRHVYVETLRVDDALQRLLRRGARAGEA